MYNTLKSYNAFKLLGVLIICVLLCDYTVDSRVDLPFMLMRGIYALYHMWCTNHVHLHNIGFLHSICGVINPKFVLVLGAFDIRTGYLVYHVVLAYSTLWLGSKFSIRNSKTYVQLRIAIASQISFIKLHAGVSSAFIPFS